MVLPPGCLACRDWIPGGREAPLVCAGCRSRLRPASWPRCPRCHHPAGTGRVAARECRECRDWPEDLTRARFAFVHRTPADDLVHALKYEGWRELAVYMATSMAALVAPEVFELRRALVVPVATTPQTLRHRGYNQAALLAQHLARARGWPLFEALQRVRTSASQTVLAPGQRRSNVRGAFGPAPGGSRRVAGRDVVLVDDVLTTGATASEAALTCGEMGAASVTVVAFARALSD